MTASPGRAFDVSTHTQSQKNAEGDDLRYTLGWCYSGNTGFVLCTMPGQNNRRIRKRIKTRIQTSRTNKVKMTQPLGYVFLNWSILAHLTTSCPVLLGQVRANIFAVIGYRSYKATLLHWWLRCAWNALMSWESRYMRFFGQNLAHHDFRWGLNCVGSSTLIECVG